MEPLLQVENLQINFHTYAGTIQAVRGLDLSLYPKDVLVVVGESGCGKTVMSKSILRLLPKKITKIPDTSKILFEGSDLLRLKEKDLRKVRGRDISMIFQDPMTYLNPTMTIGEQIAESLMIHEKLSKKQAMEKSIDILELVRIPNPKERIRQFPHEFSGGMRQRVVIAIALACSPKVLIADEPTTALDVTIQADIMDLLLDLREKLNMSIILITHDLGLAAEIATKIHVMYAGKVVEKATAKDLFNRPAHPYTRALLQSVPDVAGLSKSRLYSLKGQPPDLLNPPKGCGFMNRCALAMNVCAKHEPPLYSLSKDHSYRCWLGHPLGENNNSEERRDFNV
ncbi:ABC transporter ATP-binding protein [Isachenkonia alkalipeptolytica]|uniref:ABC transporter ATP-binding protein n=1 Tax=Isachenkonia alkalipeptolytica TaxID=2565777 RepID=A0AA43XII3_9CLOT|nr:ABC transporter ATP-binding protein [Isachenkonia alkalipeptolytica]NBG87202.1 ABC transporter ATP-binding protein [Isachenkonia alkalipeptolytica]